MSFTNVKYEFEFKDPTPVMNHRMIIAGNNLMVFGGTDGETFFNELHQYNIPTNTWKVLTTLNNEHKPSPRADHCMAFFPPDQILIYAGRNEE